MTYTAWSAYGPHAVPLERINPDRIYDDEQQTALSPRAGGVEQSSFPRSALPLSSLEKPRGVSKSASPIFSNRDRLQLIADGE